MHVGGISSYVRLGFHSSKCSNGSLPVACRLFEFGPQCPWAEAVITSVEYGTKCGSVVVLRDAEVWEDSSMVRSLCGTAWRGFSLAMLVGSYVLRESTILEVGGPNWCLFCCCGSLVFSARQIGWDYISKEEAEKTSPLTPNLLVTNYIVWINADQFRVGTRILYCNRRKMADAVVVLRGLREIPLFRQASRYAARPLARISSLSHA
jgi:hypothetical protein